MARFFLFLAVITAPLALSGCLVRTAVGVAAETVEGAVEITGAAVDAAIPDGDKKDKKKHRD
ncbi:MAG: NF038104 family lipoprotein [Henriciella sp.]|uniref:NF038104 family lipoprotein n=1 Tax=Henriciella sp. TaxID=1968823 RepID=UPI0026081D7A|nr:NF038104 family lipoprotein [Henriciella sp.]